MIIIIRMILVIAILLEGIYYFRKVLSEFRWVRLVREKSVHSGNRIFVVEDEKLNELFNSVFGGGLCIVGGDIYVSQYAAGEEYIVGHELGHRACKHQLKIMIIRSMIFPVQLIALLTGGILSWIVCVTCCQLLLTSFSLLTEVEADTFVTDKRSLARNLRYFCTQMEKSYMVSFLNYRISRLIY